MDNIITHYFRLRSQGVKPATAWAYACSIDGIDMEIWL